MNFDLLRGGGGAAGKTFATMLLHWRFPLILYATCFFLKKLNFNLLTPRVGGGGEGVCGHFFFATMLLHP